MKNVSFKKSMQVMFWVAFSCSVLFFVFTVSEKNTKNYLITLAASFLYTFGYFLPNYFLKEYLDTKFPWIDNTKSRAIITVIATILLNVVLTFLLNFINFVLIQDTSVQDFFSSKFGFTNWFFINLSLLIATFLHARGFMLVIQKNTNNKINQQTILVNSANAQYESLKNQLDPHFLFNSLNVLDALIDENPPLAQRFTHDLSKVYRYVLDQKDKELVTAKQEMDFAKTYSELMKIRFEDALFIELEDNINFENLFVVSLSLQLLLENAIKHNFATSKLPLSIRVYQEKSFLVVENNLQQRETLDHRQGIGISNIAYRYSMLTKENVSIEKTEKLFKIKIPLLTEKRNIMEEKKQDFHTNFAYEKAARRVNELKGFYGNLFSFCIVIPVLVVINLISSPQYHWFWWPMLGWGIGVLSHAAKTFGLGKDWEERKIKELMKKNENN
jgi:sensor histidine kinase YesM